MGYTIPLPGEEEDDAIDSGGPPTPIYGPPKPTPHDRLGITPKSTPEEVSAAWEKKTPKAGFGSLGEVGELIFPAKARRQVGAELGSFATGINPWADEMYAGASSLFSDKTYEEKLKEVQNALALSKQEFPYRSGGAELLGMGMGMGGAQKALSTGIKAVPKLAAFAKAKPIASGLAQSSALGGLYESGRAEPGIENRVVGGSIGAATYPVMDLGFMGVMKLGRGLGSFITKIPSGVSDAYRQNVDRITTSRTKETVSETLTAFMKTAEEEISLLKRSADIAEESLGAAKKETQAYIGETGANITSAEQRAAAIKSLKHKASVAVSAAKAGLDDAIERAGSLSETAKVASSQFVYDLEQTMKTAVEDIVGKASTAVKQVGGLRDFYSQEARSDLIAGGKPVFIKDMENAIGAKISSIPKEPGGAPYAEYKDVNSLLGRWAERLNQYAEGKDMPDGLAETIRQAMGRDGQKATSKWTDILSKYKNGEVPPEEAIKLMDMANKDLKDIYNKWDSIVAGYRDKNISPNDAFKMIDAIDTEINRIGAFTPGKDSPKIRQLKGLRLEIRNAIEVSSPEYGVTMATEVANRASLTSSLKNKPEKLRSLVRDAVDKGYYESQDILKNISELSGLPLGGDLAAIENMIKDIEKIKGGLKSAPIPQVAESEAANLAKQEAKMGYRSAKAEAGAIGEDLYGAGEEVARLKAEKSAGLSKLMSREAELGRSRDVTKEAVSRAEGGLKQYPSSKEVPANIQSYMNNIKDRLKSGRNVNLNDREIEKVMQEFADFAGDSSIPQELKDSAIKELIGEAAAPVGSKLGSMINSMSRGTIMGLAGGTAAGYMVSPQLTFAVAAMSGAAAWLGPKAGQAYLKGMAKGGAVGAGFRAVGEAFAKARSRPGIAPIPAAYAFHKITMRNNPEYAEYIKNELGGE